jgi:hypothetical protein
MIFDSLFRSTCTQALAFDLHLSGLICLCLCVRASTGWLVDGC